VGEWDDAWSERFDKFVVVTEDHWLWIGYVDPEDGYGRFKAAGRSQRTHRLAYSRWKGPLNDPDEKRVIVDHECRVRRCVNPDHLRLTTYRVNTENSDSPIAENMRKEACSRGHPFSPENTYVVKGGRTWPGGRACKTCRREWVASYRARKAAADRETPPPEPASSTRLPSATRRRPVLATATTRPSPRD